MTKRKKIEAYKEIIVEAILEKKGQNITILDFEELENTSSDLFIICEGNSTTQLNAIVDSIEEFMRVHLGEKPWHIEGESNQSWILMDYVNVVIHVFTPETRHFYNIEELWADAKITQITENSSLIK
ncbi:MAG: ribosome silencing factor [Flavobacteriales bacterium]|jgi:ribosome-associated protein|nr:ribosome silencing factor [Flavobacteriales bacterium]